MKTYRDFINAYNGKTIDDDGAYGAQCVDGFRVFCKWIGIPAYPTGTGWADGYWYYRDKIADSFDFITDPDALQPGDICFWARGSSCPDSHVAMFTGYAKPGHGLFFGQNQGEFKGFQTVGIKLDILGAFRWKGWNMEPLKIIPGSNDVEVNGRSYALYRQKSTQRIGIIAAPLNTVEYLERLDADILVFAKIAGANYYQMSAKAYDPYGTCYGDISSPISGVYQNLPNQDSTLWYDLDTGEYGDCWGKTIDPTHNVFSPAVVYPKEGPYMYSTMPTVGMNHISIDSMYTFVVRFDDGTYMLGITKEPTCPAKIYRDFRDIEGFHSIAFLDGGGSAQMIRGYYTIRDTGRPIPSVVAIYKDLTDDKIEENLLELEQEVSGCDDCVFDIPEEDPMEDETGAGGTEIERELKALRDELDIVKKEAGMWAGRYNKLINGLAKLLEEDDAGN